MFPGTKTVLVPLQWVGGLVGGWWVMVLSLSTILSLLFLSLTMPHGDFSVPPPPPPLGMHLGLNESALQPPSPPALIASLTRAPDLPVYLPNLHCNCGSPKARQSF